MHSLDIAWIVPDVVDGQGGLRNIYRAAYFLHGFGHKVSIYACSKLSADAYRANVESYYDYSMEGIEFINYQGQLNRHQVCLATHWLTAYELKKNEAHVEMPAYFIQDFEPYFSPMSTNFILAEQTYSFGYVPVCSGPWIAAHLKENYGLDANFFQFPFDRSVYYAKESNRKSNNVIFYARPDQPRRCYEFGLKMLEEFATLCPEVEISLFGSNTIDENAIAFPCSIKKQLPTINDLAELYRQSTLGIVFSPTNPSLVPYEMMACGCPVCDIDYNAAPSRYGNRNDCCFLLTPYPETAARELSKIVKDQALLYRTAQNASEYVSGFPTEYEAAKRIEEIIVTAYSKIKA